MSGPLQTAAASPGAAGMEAALARLGEEYQAKLEREISRVVGPDGETSFEYRAALDELYANRSAWSPADFEVEAIRLIRALGMARAREDRSPVRVRQQIAIDTLRRAWGTNQPPFLGIDMQNPGDSYVSLIYGTTTVREAYGLPLDQQVEIPIAYVDWRTRKFNATNPYDEPGLEPSLITPTDIVDLSRLSRAVVLAAARRLAARQAGRRAAARGLVHRAELPPMIIKRDRGLEALAARTATSTVRPPLRVGNPVASSAATRVAGSAAAPLARPARRAKRQLTPAQVRRLRAVHPALPKLFRDRPLISFDDDTINELGNLYRATSTPGRTYPNKRAATGALAVIERVHASPNTLSIRLLKPSNQPGSRTPDLRVATADGRHYHVEITTPTLGRRGQRTPNPAPGERVAPPADKTRAPTNDEVYEAFRKKIEWEQISAAPRGVIVVNLQREPTGGFALTAAQVANLEALIHQRAHVLELIVVVPRAGGRQILQVGARNSGLGLSRGRLATR